MFISKERLKNIEQRISDLECPYKFKTGDAVYCSRYSADIKMQKGVVVSMRSKYFPDWNQQRQNYYIVYNQIDKFSAEMYESDLDLITETK